MRTFAGVRRVFRHQHARAYACESVWAVGAIRQRRLVLSVWYAASVLGNLFHANLQCKDFCTRVRFGS